MQIRAGAAAESPRPQSTGTRLDSWTAGNFGRAASEEAFSRRAISDKQDICLTTADKGNGI
jgi:hypothetical protein